MLVKNNINIKNWMKILTEHFLRKKIIITQKNWMKQIKLEQKNWIKSNNGTPSLRESSSGCGKSNNETLSYYEIIFTQKIV